MSERRPHPPSPNPSPRLPAWRRWLTWGSLAIALLLAGALTVSWVLRESSPQYSDQLRTASAPGSLPLPDGSRIEAAPDTALSVAYYPRRRYVSMTRGEADFRVRWQYRASFNVQSGVNEVVIDGTRIEQPEIAFRVVATPERLQVALREGKLKVRTVTAGPREFVELEPGDVLTVDMNARRHSLERAAGG
ncbi:MAG: FecR domain-containing protein [Pigmentiphaga sp.]|uniref:FecR domain-containing protein n=1 Tax=Pigmentiphaga sp. TaxID=1977564 RepID=UPI0029A51B43|nr:FecR domain-containing protein [Pigmentiphaga sp.]MDX3905453.1 FecR domain-containing protein [Pigmentiphaga sp.]